MATSVASPLERHLGQIADVTEMTSTSSVGQARIMLQFGLDRDIDGAARDVQAAINAARADLPTSLRSNPTYRKVNPADAPILILALTSKTLTRGQIYDAASNVLQQQLSQVDGIGEVHHRRLARCRRCAWSSIRRRCSSTASDWRTCAPRLASANANSPKGAIEDGDRHYQIYTNDQASKAADYRAADHRLPQRRAGAAVRRGRRAGFGREPAQRGRGERQAGGAGDPVPPAGRQHHRCCRRGEGGAAAA